MNALELLAALEKSGTGAAKMDAARGVAVALGTTLKAMPGEALLEEMRKRYARWRDLLDMGAPRKPPECQPGLTCWAEGTIAKAARILAGQPADPEAMTSSSVYDVDEPRPEPRPATEPELEDEPPTPPGVRAKDPADAMSLPGVRQAGKRVRKPPAKELHSFGELAGEMDPEHGGHE